jgi:hypothetical protein
MVNFYTYFITCNSTATINDVIGMLNPNSSVRIVMLGTRFKMTLVGLQYLYLLAQYRYSCTLQTNKNKLCGP